MTLIDRDEIVKVAEHAYKEWNLAMAAADGEREINYTFKMQDLCKAVKAVAMAAPVVDAAPVVHGEWKGITRSRFYGIDEYSDPIYRDGIIWHCSKCSRRSVIKTNYCPNCGAKMDGGK